MKLCTCFGKRLGTQGRDFSACYLGGTRNKGFATLRNISKLFPNAPKLLRNQFQISSSSLIVIILARNIDYKSVLQKTLKQFGPVASKYERNRDIRAIFIESNFADEFPCVLLCRATFFSKVRFSLAFYRRNLVFSPEIQLVMRFIPWKTQIYQFCVDIKFQFNTTARSKLFCVVLFIFSKSSGRKNAKYAFQYSFKNNTSQQAKKERKKESTKQGPSRRYSRQVTHPVPCPA